ncbi:MAG: hypothetical protein SNG69_06590 [Rikenellaceae bacterium]
MTHKTANIEVPAVLKECLLSLTEVREKIEGYCPKSDISDSIDQNAGRFDDLIGDAVHQIGEMIRMEVVNAYYYKNK